MNKFEEKISQKSPSKTLPVSTLSTGSDIIKLSAKKNQSIADICVLCSPFEQAQHKAWGVDSRPPSCINYDDIIDCVRLYPKFRDYFAEKLAGVARMQDRIDNPGLRCKGETLTWLMWWYNHYAKQIQNMIDYWLPKKDKTNG